MILSIKSVRILSIKGLLKRVQEHVSHTVQEHELLIYTSKGILCVRFNFSKFQGLQVWNLARLITILGWDQKETLGS